MANVSSSNGIEKHPKLRFPEFSEPWERVRIGDVYAERNERGAESAELLSVTMTEGVKRRSDIEGKDNSSEDKGNYKVVRIGDMVYNSMRMWQGANGISDYDGIVSPAYTVMKAKREIANGFFAALFKTHRMIGEFCRHSQGMTSDTWNLKYPQIESIQTYIPTVTEQRKIADMLMYLDRRIEKQQQLLEHLKKYKRGVDASFFDIKRQHCEKELYGWDCVPFGDVVAINPKTPALPEHFIYIDLESVDFGRLQCLKHINRKDAPSRAQRVLADSDVLFQMVRPYQKNNYFFKDIFNSPVVASTGYAQIRCLGCDPVFVFEQISSDYFSQEAMLRSTGTGYPAINSEGLAEIPFFLPSLPEQKKIGEFLSLLRTKIEYENGQLDVLNKLKTALLQQLFI